MFDKLKNWFSYFAITRAEDHKINGKLFAIDYFDGCDTVEKLDELYNKLPDSDREHPFDVAVTAYYNKLHYRLTSDLNWDLIND